MEVIKGEGEQTWWQDYIDIFKMVDRRCVREKTPGVRRVRGSLMGIVKQMK